MALTKKQKEISAKWYNAKKELDAVKKLEGELRIEMINTFYPKGLAKGVNKADLEGGFQMKATPAYNYKLDEAKLPIVLKGIKEKFKINLPLLVKTKLELSVGEYGKLSDEVKEAFNDCLTITNGTPQVEIVLPKR